MTISCWWYRPASNLCLSLLLARIQIETLDRSSKQTKLNWKKGVAAPERSYTERERWRERVVVDIGFEWAERVNWKPQLLRSVHGMKNYGSKCQFGKCSIHSGNPFPQLDFDVPRSFVSLPSHRIHNSLMSVCLYVHLLFNIFASNEISLLFHSRLKFHYKFVHARTESLVKSISKKDQKNFTVTWRQRMPRQSNICYIMLYAFLVYMYMYIYFFIFWESIRKTGLWYSVDPDVNARGYVDYCWAEEWHARVVSRHVVPETSLFVSQTQPNWWNYINTHTNASQFQMYFYICE